MGAAGRAIAADQCCTSIRDQAALQRRAFSVGANRRVRNGKRELALLRWGLIASWAKEASISYRTINARAETVATSPAFRDAFKARRCIIPASGFYEWQQVPGGRK